jgi:hypothetical protein
MESEAQSAAQHKLDEVQREVGQWRQTRPRSKEMPKELWESATLLAQMLGVNTVVRRLGLNYSALKQRVAPGGSESRRGKREEGSPRANRKGFIELSKVPLLGIPPNDEAVVEVMAKDGARLSIKLKAGNHLDVTALVRAFQERRR